MKSEKFAAAITVQKEIIHFSLFTFSLILQQPQLQPNAMHG